MRPAVQLLLAPHAGRAPSCSAGCSSAYGAEPCREVRAAAAVRRPRQADPQGGAAVERDRPLRTPRADHLRVHGDRRVRRLSRSAPAWTVNGFIQRRVATAPPRAATDLRARLDRDLRLHRRPGAFRVEKPTLGSMRTCASLSSHEVALALSALGTVILGHSLSLPDIVDRQGVLIPSWSRSSSSCSCSSSPASPRRAARRSTCPKPSLSSSPDTTRVLRDALGPLPDVGYINLITLSGCTVTLFFACSGTPLEPRRIAVVPAQAVRLLPLLDLPAPPPWLPRRPADALLVEGAGGRSRRSTP